MSAPLPLAANLAFLFPELPWPRRPATAAELGFDTVELPWPGEETGVVVDAMLAAGVRVALLNIDAGNLAAGSRGFGNDPQRVEDWRSAAREAIEVSRALGGPALNALAGNRLRDAGEQEQRECLVANLRWAARLAATDDVRVVVEPLNPRDAPDYLVPSTKDGLQLLAEVAAPEVGLQLDVYHVARSGADPAAELRVAGRRLWHVQVADCPGRGEPGTGSVDFASVTAALRDVGYAGAVGLEYVPTEPLPRSVARWRRALGSAA